METGEKDTAVRNFSNRDLKKLIIPLIMEQALAITVGMADTMMISSVGEAAVSGVSLVDLFNNFIISMLAALATGGAVVTRQFIGASKREEACRSAKQLLWVNAVITIIISVLVIAGHRLILNLFFGKIEADVMRNAITYLIISAVSFPFLAVYNACAALFRSMGNSRITLKVSILMNIINVGGNAICVFGLKMGVAGVAVPSLISRAVAGFILYLLLRNPDNPIHLSRERFRFEWNVAQKILYIGIPSGIENGIFQLGRVVVVSIIAGFGTAQIAANGVANSLAGDLAQVRYYTKKLLLITYAATAVINSLILLFLHPILALYGLGEEATGLAYILVMIHDGMAMLLWPASFVLPNMLRACNDVKYTMVTAIFSMVAFRIGLSLMFGVHMGMGAIGVWTAMVVDWIFRVCCFVGRYFRGTWRRHCNL